MLHGVVLGVALAACSESPVAPTAGPAFAKGGVTFTEFTATYVATGLLDPGTQKVEAGVVETRGLTATGMVISTTLGISCNAVVEINSDLLLSNATGPVWGKMIECVTADEGVWAGSFDGYRVMSTGPSWVTTLKLVFRGVSGSARGYQVRATQVATSNDPANLGFTADISGVLFDPNPR
ncbi:MAG TPA: hypothetical protein VF862_09555 [Gemmatimonadales bacterium]